MHEGSQDGSDGGARYPGTARPLAYATKDTYRPVRWLCAEILMFVAFGGATRRAALRRVPAHVAWHRRRNCGAGGRNSPESLASEWRPATPEGGCERSTNHEVGRVPTSSVRWGRGSRGSRNPLGVLMDPRPNGGDEGIEGRSENAEDRGEGVAPVGRLSRLCRREWRPIPQGHDRTAGLGQSICASVRSIESLCVLWRWDQDEAEKAVVLIGGEVRQCRDHRDLVRWRSAGPQYG